MNRRDFMRNTLPMAVIGATTVAGIANAPPPGNYRFAGHIHANDAAMWSIDYITLDGERVERVWECNDVEGWLRCHVGGFGTLGGHHERLRIEYRTGVVRLHWKA
jgi:hypothetical protein